MIKSFSLLVFTLLSVNVFGNEIDMIFANEGRQTEIASDLLSQAREALNLSGVSGINQGSMKVFFQEMYFNKGTPVEDNRSRILVIAEPLFSSNNEAIYIGYVISNSTGTRQVTIVRGSTDAANNQYFTLTENTASLFISKAVRDLGKEAVKNALDSVKSKIAAKFPTFQMNSLNLLGVVNVAASSDVSLSDKVNFLKQLQSLDEIEDSSKLGFNIKDVILGGT